MRIGDVADATGLTQRAIRYYEALDLLTPALRRSGANRRYEHDDVERLLFIKRLREDVGLSLAEIRTYLEIEDLRRTIKSEYLSVEDPIVHLELLDRVEAGIRRRVVMLDRKLALVSALRAQDEASLERVAALRNEQGARLHGAAVGV